MTRCAGSVLVLALLAGAPAAAQQPETLVTAPEPIASIGLLEGAEAYVLHGVVDALRQSNGNIVVANCGSSELRIYDASGTHVRTVGGKGEGRASSRS